MRITATRQLDGAARLGVLLLLMGLSSPCPGQAQAIDEMFGADLLIGYGTANSYASGFGVRVGARVTPTARRGFIVGARGVWHSGAPFEDFEALGGGSVRVGVDRSVSYYAAELGPVWFYGDGGRTRIRLFALMGYAFIGTRYSREWNDSALFAGAGFDAAVRVWRITVGGELGFIPTSDLGTVFFYGHVGGLWDG